MKKAKLFLLFILFMALVQMMWGHTVHAQIVTQDDQRAEKFMAGKALQDVTVSLREEATVVGSDVRLKQIARWSDADKDILDPIGELIVAHVGDKSAQQAVGVNDVKALLRDAGINLSNINFAGNTRCAVRRSDAVFDQDAALEKWAKENAPPATKPAEEARNEVAPATKTAPPPTQPIVAENPYKNLQQLLVDNLAAKLHIPAETLQITFRGQDDRVLRLTEPHCKFTIEPQRCGNLGDVSWNVVVISGDATSKYFIQANARAWQEQLILARPMAFKQQITEADIEPRRTLTDKMPEDVLLRKEQVIGQVTSRDLRVGTVMTARQVEAPLMVRHGQFVTVELTSGGVVVKTAVRALEDGAYGQSIHVKNETTKDIFKITVTGPQQGSMGDTPVVTTE